VIAMMQEMYEWYMENLFPEHRRQAIKHAEKDSRDRKKRLAQGPKSRMPTDLVWADIAPTNANLMKFKDRYRGRSKWERIGSPFVASTVDWVVIVNPWDFRPGWQKRRLAAVSRQKERYDEYSN